MLVVGSGFAGSVLAGCLARAGRRVLMVERGSHPRFALGESSTPLANLALERLARRTGWRELQELATWGRWQRHHRSIRCGLKRGFTFFDARDEALSARTVMVAASPSDDEADTQWMRSDLDAFLVKQARSAGCRYLDHTSVDRLSIGDAGVEASGTCAGQRLRIEAQFVVDASGAGGFLARHLDLPERESLPFRSSLLFGHWRDQGFLERGVDSAGGLTLPYSPDWSAVHALLDVGWMYQLRFDEGTTSCGWLLDHRRCSESGLDLSVGRENPQALHDLLLERYPMLSRQFGRARLATPLGWRESVQWRCERAAGARFALLPQSFAFYDPMFSTGIAWSLVAVERLCDLLLSESVSKEALRRYQILLDREGDHIERLLQGAYLVLDDVEAMGWYSQIYFAAASFSEIEQRLWPSPTAQRTAVDRSVRSSAANVVDGLTFESWHWRGFLGAEDPIVTHALEQALQIAAGPDPARRLAREVPGLIAARNLTGLADERKHPRYPVDLDTVVDACHLLGLDEAEARALLPRLSGVWDGGVRDDGVRDDAGVGEDF